MNLSKLIEIVISIFSKKEISNLSMKEFTSDHVYKMEVKNIDGWLTTRIDITRTKQIALGKCITNIVTEVVTQVGCTLSVDEIAEGFVMVTRNYFNIIMVAFGTNPIIINQYYPHGKTQYDRVKRSNLGTLCDQMINAGTLYPHASLPNIVEDFTNIKQNFISVRGDQIEQISEVSGIRTELHDARDAVNKQVWSNILFIGSHFVDDTDAMSDFVNPSIFSRTKKHNSHLKVPFDGVVGVNSTKVITNAFDAKCRFIFYNTGVTVLTFCCSDNLDEICVSGMSVAPGGSATIDAKMLNEINGKNLKVTNADLEREGTWDVIVLHTDIIV